MFRPLNRVLLVEADDHDAQLLRLYLGDVPDLRVELERVRDADAALTRLREADYDALLLAASQGEQVAALHRIIDLAPQLPVVVLSEGEDPGQDAELLHLGAQDVLPKSHLSGPILARVLRYARERKRTEEMLRTSQMMLEARVEDRTRHLSELNRRLEAEIRQREEVERALRRETAFVTTVLDTVPTLVLVVDRGGRIHDVNRALIELTGEDRERLRGRLSWEALVPPEHEGAVRAALAEVLERDRPVSLELPLPTRERGTRTVQWTGVPLVGEEGEVEYLVVCGSDVTEQQAAKERERRQLMDLAQAARLSTMGEMAAEIAHELNQPLSAISNYARAGHMLVRRGESDPELISQALDEIAAQAQRAGEVIRRLRRFVGKSELARTPCEVNGLLRDSLALIEIEARWNGVALETRLAEGLPQVFADPVLIGQVILNLARNAIEAMSEVPEDRRRLTLRTAPGQDGMVLIEVEDTGPGMDEDRIRQIFDRFFTTKRQGMGIGLAICRSIAESHGGRLGVRSRPGEGALFQLHLPEWHDD